MRNRETLLETVLTETVPFTTSEARAAEEAGTATLKVKFDVGNPADAIAMRNAAAHTFMRFRIGLTKVATSDKAVNAGDIERAGQDWSDANIPSLHLSAPTRAPIHPQSRLTKSAAIW